jgi:enoyl-CoA hydratase/carnithine racemase
MLRCERGEVAVLTLDRPPANALTRAFFEEMVARLEQLERDDSVRAVVLTGTGAFFSAGLDLFEVFDTPPAEFQAFTAAFDAGFTALFSFPKPVVAAVNGHAIAGGIVLAAAADVRLLATGTAKLGLTEVLVGVPFPASAFEIVRFSCRGPDLQEVLYHGRTYSSDAARARRLVDEIVEPAELIPAALQSARELGSRPAVAFAGIKGALRAEALARMRAHPPGADPVWKTWYSPQVRADVEAFRKRTLEAKARN